MLDFARLFPPEPPVRTGACLYNLLRPELVSKSDAPVNSDSFTMFGKQDKEQDSMIIGELMKKLDDSYHHFCSLLSSIDLRMLQSHLLALNRQAPKTATSNWLQISIDAESTSATWATCALSAQASSSQSY
jgi:hypothetical protein